MCTRFLLEQARLRALAAALDLPAGAAEVVAPRDRFNIAPGGPVSALRSLTGVFHPHWGFRLPVYGATPAAPLVNARAESLADRPAFREAFARRRCLVPATGFYEWQKLGRARLPWLFRIEDPDTPGTPAPFCLAGLWERAPDGAASVVVVTTAANAVMAPVHDRMPALLRDAEACRAWLDPHTPPAALAALLAPADAATLTATPVSPRINRPDFDSPECLTPVTHGLAARDTPDGDGQEFAFP